MSVVENKKSGGMEVRKILAMLGPVIGLVFVFALFSVLQPKTFLNVDNMQIILRQTAVIGTAAIGMTLIIIAGGIDLAVGSTIAIGVVTIALMLKAGYPPVLAALGGIAACTAAGACSGMLITRLKLLPFIVTLGLMGALRGGAKGLADSQVVYPPRTDDITNSWIMKLLSGLKDENSWMLLPPGVWLMLVLAVLVALMLRFTRFGRHIFAVGSNEQTARLCGVNVDRVKIMVYTMGALFAGIAAVLQFSYIRVGDPTTAEGYELGVIAAVVIGGASLAGGEGRIAGSLIGAIIMTMVANGCTKMGFDNWVQQIATGFIIIAAVMLDKLRQRRSA
jgi:ribose transport system permease protein